MIKQLLLKNLQKIGVQIKHVFSVSKIVLSPEKEKIIRESFVDQELQFCYPHDTEDFNYLIENFTKKQSDYLDNAMGENLMIDKLIVMDDVSGLADKSTNFSNFLKVSRKYGFSCVYVFHTIYPNRQNWEILMSQTHIFKFSPGSIHNSKILKILSLFVNRQKTLIYLIYRFGLINFIMKYPILKKKMLDNRY